MPSGIVSAGLDAWPDGDEGDLQLVVLNADGVVHASCGKS
jgi:hypothetical protein